MPKFEETDKAKHWRWFYKMKERIGGMFGFQDAKLDEFLLDR